MPPGVNTQMRTLTWCSYLLDSYLKEYIPGKAGRIPGNIRERMFPPRDIASSDFIKFLFMAEMC